MARFYCRGGRTREAAPLYRAGLALKPDDARALENPRRAEALSRARGG